MSLNFSRRSFMKYTALAAVAVAGSSLFTACSDTSDENNPVLAKAGSLTILQVTGVMGTYDSSTKKYTDPSITGTEIVFPLKITNSRENPLYIFPSNFKATVSSADGKTTTKYSYWTGGLTVSSGLIETNLKTDKSVSGTVTVKLSKALEEGEAITLTYCPDLQYNEYTMNWTLTNSSSSAS